MARLSTVVSSLEITCVLLRPKTCYFATDNWQLSPAAVAIIGFDDLPIAAYTNPGLTTVATQAIAQGEQAALAAIELLKGQPVGKRNCNLSLELVIRESCGAERTDRSREGRRLPI